MKLSEYAKSKGLSYLTVYRMFKAGKIPHPTEQLPTGTILIYPEQDPKPGKTALYARVSSHDQKKELTRQIHRGRDFCAAKGLSIDQEITEIGAGMHETRKKLIQLLADASITTIVVEQQDRLTRFGFEYVEAALRATNRNILVMNETECTDDLEQDMLEVLTSFCARLYGRRSAKLRAKKALEACQL